MADCCSVFFYASLLQTIDGVMPLALCLQVTNSSTLQPFQMQVLELLASFAVMSTSEYMFQEKETKQPTLF